MSEFSSPKPAAEGVAAASARPGGPAPRSWPRRSASRAPSRIVQVTLAVGTTLALIAVWELLARIEFLPEEVPPVTSTFSWLGEQASTSHFWNSVGQTLWHWAGGLVLGSLAGLAVGVLIGAVPILQRLFQTPFEFLRPIPPVVYLPIFVLVMGATSKMAIVLVAIGTFWPMMFQTYYGVIAVEPMAIDTGRVFGLTRRQRLLRITLPSTLPYIATGLRVSSSLALVIAISVELIGGVVGLGSDLTAYSVNGLYVGIYGTLFVSGVLGMTLNVLLESVDRRLLKWHVSNRSSRA